MGTGFDAYDDLDDALGDMDMSAFNDDFSAPSSTVHAIPAVNVCSAVGAGLQQAVQAVVDPLVGDSVSNSQAAKASEHESAPVANDAGHLGPAMGAQDPAPGDGDLPAEGGEEEEYEDGPVIAEEYLVTLKKYFGHSNFRPMQWAIISSAMLDRYAPQSLHTLAESLCMPDVLVQGRQIERQRHKVRITFK